MSKRRQIPHNFVSDLASFAQRKYPPRQKLIFMLHIVNLMIIIVNLSNSFVPKGSLDINSKPISSINILVI